MKIKYIFQVIIITLVVLFAFSCGFLSRKHEKKETVEYKLNAQNKTKIVFKNVSGDFTVSKSDSVTGLVVRAEKIGYVTKKDIDKPLDNIKINIDSSSDVITISSESTKEKGWIHFDIHKNEVNYNIKLPTGIKLNIDNVNGDIDMSNISNETDIKTINGKITLDNLTGLHDIGVTNGSIKGSIDSVKNFRADVVNGNINLNLGKNFTGDVKADIVNGKITYDNLNFSDVSSEKKSFHGYIGNKQNELRLNVVNGKISLNGTASAKTSDNTK